MAKSKLSPNFRFSHENLYQLSYQTAYLMERDLTEFENYGINQTNVDEFRAVANQFETGGFDNEYLGDQMTQTEAKNLLVEEIRSDLQNVMLKLRTHFGTKSVLYLQFKNREISKFTDAELGSQFRISIDILRKHISQLEACGITADMLDVLDQKRANLSEVLHSQQFAKHIRDIYTQERMLRANKLYSLLSKYSYLGRNMWKNDEAKSNDYVIYGSSSAPPESPENSDDGGEGEEEMPNG